MSERVVHIFFCLMENMSPGLMTIAMQQGFDCESLDLVAVKTKLSDESSAPITYEFELITPTPEGIRDYMAKLGREDGVTDWDAALGRAFSDEFVPKLPKEKEENELP